jgi:superoxide dismutase, Fe-Mn family
MTFTLPSLRYDYSALEPHIDARTMEIHHTKHHGGYTAKLNKAVEGTDLEGKSIEEILTGVSNSPVAVRNNGGGYYNHNLFWDVMSPGGGGKPTGELLQAIEKAFGSFDDFTKEFSNAATTRFGSGWAWLAQKEDGTLFVCSTPNQDNPLMDVSEHQAKKLILGLDVWEHAYYLKYQNKRPEYIQAFWNVIDWDEVKKRFKM